MITFAKHLSIGSAACALAAAAALTMAPGASAEDPVECDFTDLSCQAEIPGGNGDGNYELAEAILGAPGVEELVVRPLVNFFDEWDGQDDDAVTFLGYTVELDPDGDGVGVYGPDSA